MMDLETIRKQQISDMMSDIVKLTKERDEALEKLAPMEHAVNVSNQHLECYRKTYGSVPADKPAVAVDERTNSRGEPEAIYLQLHDPDSFSETEAGDFRADGVTWCWHKINHNDVRYIRQDLASTSHIQPSAEPNGVPSYDAEAGERMENYCRSFGEFAPRFPAQFRWQKLYNAALGLPVTDEFEGYPSHESEQ